MRMMRPRTTLCNQQPQRPSGRVPRHPDHRWPDSNADHCCLNCCCSPIIQRYLHLPNTNCCLHWCRCPLLLEPGDRCGCHRCCCWYYHDVKSFCYQSHQLIITLLRQGTRVGKFEVLCLLSWSPKVARHHGPSTNLQFIDVPEAAPDYIMQSTTPDALRASLTEKWPDIMRSWTTLCN